MFIIPYFLCSKQNLSIACSRPYFINFNLLVSGGSWWTGARKDENKDHWVWDHSDTEVVFTNWDSKNFQPDGSNDENCVLSVFGLWHDYPCNYTFYIICERGE